MHGRRGERKMKMRKEWKGGGMSRVKEDEISMAGKDGEKKRKEVG